MGLPRFLAENFFNGVQQGYTLTANEEAADHEVWHLGDNRRSGRSYWTPTTDNSSAWVKADAGSGNSPKADMIVVDRGSNLDGEQVTLETSSDDSTWSQVFQATLPTSEATDGDLSASSGILTEELAWMKSFPSTSARYWRLTVSAMGSGERPQITGLWLGDSYEPNLHFARPFSWGKRRVTANETSNALGWRGSTQPAEGREGAYTLKMKNESEYDTARYHIEELYLSGEPMWMVLDQTKAERSWLSRVSPGSGGFEEADDWGFQQISFRAREHQPETP